jgi:thiamine pyrophosphate-dependent acetolactate synthase large subunit-like protein
MKKTAAEFMAQTLLDAGVKRVFGVVGAGPGDRGAYPQQ